MTQYSLIFYPDAPDGCLIDPSTIVGTLVKAGLGVRTPLGDQRPWQSLYTTDHARYVSYRAREAAVRWMAELVPVLAAQGFYQRVAYKHLCLGRTVFDFALHRMFHAIHKLMLIDAFRRHHGIAHFYTWRADELPQDLREALAAYSAATGVAFEALPAPACAPASGPVAPLYGHYEYFGSLGREIAAIRPGANIAFPNQTMTWGYTDFDRAKLPIFIPVADPHGGIALQLRLVYAYCEKGVPTITLANATHEAVVTVEPNGVFDRAADPPLHLAPAPGPMEFAFTAILIDGAAWFGRLGEACQPLRLRPRSNDAADPAGVRIDCPDSQWPLLRFGELTVLTNLLRASIAERIGGLSRVMGETQRHPVAASTPPTRVGVVVPSSNHMIAAWPHLGRHSAPIHFDGLAASFAAQGLDACEFHVGAPWHLGAKQERDRTSGFVIDSIVLPDAIAAEAKAGCKAADDARVEILADMTIPPLPTETDLPATVDLGPLLLRALNESAQWSGWYAEQYEKMRLALVREPVAAMLSPRIDSGFLPTAAAARSIGVPVASLEISFLIHEHQRLHRLAGVPETSNAIFYWGQGALERIQGFRIDTSGLAVTGLHSLDYFSSIRTLRAQHKIETSRYWAALGVPRVEGPVILLAAHLGGRQSIADIDMYSETIGSVLEALTGAGRGTLVVKTLTTDDPETISRVCGKFEQSRLRLLSPSHPFQNAHYLFGADIMIGAPTTMHAEATAAGTPAFTLDYLGHENWYPVSALQLERLGRIAPVIDSPASLRSLIKSVVESGSNWQAPAAADMASLFGDIDGQVCYRTLEAWRKLGGPL